MKTRPSGSATNVPSYQFCDGVLTVHSAAEDGIIFAALRLRGIDVPAGQLLADHQRELANIYDVHRLLVEVRFLGDEEPSSVPLTQARDAARRLHDDLLDHLGYEEEHVIPMVLARVAPDDQVRLLGKVLAENPPELVPREHDDPRARRLQQALEDGAAPVPTRSVGPHFRSTGATPLRPGRPARSSSGSRSGTGDRASMSTSTRCTSGTRL